MSKSICYFYFKIFHISYLALHIKHVANAQCRHFTCSQPCVEAERDCCVIARAVTQAVDAAALDQLLHPALDPKAKKDIVAKGLPASPGAASGEIVFDADEAERLKSLNHRVILVRIETSPEDIHGMHAARGIIGSIPKSLQEVAVDFYVNVTNTGSLDADDVVLGFLVPPGAGSGGVALQELFGFERVFVRAGETVTVYLGAQGVRFTQAGADGVRRALAGEYTARFGVKESAALGMGYAELAIRAY